MSSDRKGLEADLTHFVQSRGTRYAQATLQTDLLETGMLDSLLLMDLIFHIEGAYGVRFDSDQVNPSNFRTIENTVSFVLKQKALAQA